MKRVTNAGTFRFKRRLLFIANALKQHHIGLEEIDDGIWSICLGQVLLGRGDERDFIIRDRPHVLPMFPVAQATHDELYDPDSPTPCPSAPAVTYGSLNPLDISHTARTRLARPNGTPKSVGKGMLYPANSGNVIPMN